MSQNLRYLILEISRFDCTLFRFRCSSTLSMDSSQLIPDELMTTALFSPPPTEIAATINDKDGNPQQVQVLTTADCHPQLIQVLTDSQGCPQSLQVLADGRVVNEDSEACRNIIENGEAGLSLIQPTGGKNTVLNLLLIWG